MTASLKESFTTLLLINLHYFSEGEYMNLSPLAEMSAGLRRLLNSVWGDGLLSYFRVEECNIYFRTKDIQIKIK